MPEVEFIRAGFRHADNGITVKKYELGEHVVSDRCAEIAIAEGYARPLLPTNIPRSTRPIEMLPLSEQDLSIDPVISEDDSIGFRTGVETPVQSLPPLPRRRRGRPTNAEKAERERLLSTRHGS